jgi:hypothetical protein
MVTGTSGPAARRTSSSTNWPQATTSEAPLRARRRAARAAGSRPGTETSAPWTTTA